MYSFSALGISVKFCLGHLSHFMATKPFLCLSGSKHIPFIKYSHILSSPLHNLCIYSLISEYLNVAQDNNHYRMVTSEKVIKVKAVIIKILKDEGCSFELAYE
jgi:hypothetical protein